MITDLEKQIFAELRKSYAKAPAFLVAIEATEREIIETRENPALAAHAEGGYTGDFERGLEIYSEMVRAKVREQDSQEREEINK